MLSKPLFQFSAFKAKATALSGLVAFFSLVITGISTQSVAVESSLEHQKLQVMHQNAQAPVSWDMDGNGKVDALSDGLIILRYAFGVTGESLVDGAIATDSPLQPVEVISKVESSIAIADVDGNGSLDALSDGLLILRYLFQIRGDALIDGAVAQDGTRNTALQIENYIDSYYPGNSANPSNSPLSAVDDSFTTNQGASVSGNLQSNDKGSVNTAVIYHLTAAAENGTANINNNGTFSYTPASGFSGFDSFTYSVTDAQGNESSAAVTISVFSSAWESVTSVVTENVDSAVASILASMTTAEKVGQMVQAEISAVTANDVRQWKLGSVLNGGGSWPATAAIKY